MNTCTTCGGSRPSASRHRECDSCRKMRYNKQHSKQCPGCNKLIWYQADFCKSCKQLGTNNPKYRGGITYNSKGYLQELQSDGSYKLQHRIVMEQILGRELLETEQVHHRNRIRDDNRPENLELWTTAQPPGARVEDLLKWAKELIALYEK